MKKIINNLFKKINNKKDDKNEVKSFVRLFPNKSVEELNEYKEVLKLKLYTSRGEERKEIHKLMKSVELEIVEIQKIK